MGGLSGITAGLIGSAQGEKTIDLSALFNTIKNAGAYQKGLINSLPAEIQQKLSDYAASLGKAGATYQGNIQGQGEDFLSKIKQLYGPNSAAATAQNVANRQQIYSTVPGTQNAIRNALAATGGLSRGNAGVALAKPYVAAAGQYGQAAAGVNAQQTQAAQQATQQALTIVNSMDTTMFQNLFGMSKEQATQILNTGTQALRDQLSQLINQSANETNQTLGVEGIAAQNAYQNALQQQGYQNAVWNGLANTGIQGIQAGAGALGGVQGIFGGMSGAGGAASAAPQFADLGEMLAVA